MSKRPSIKLDNFTNKQLNEWVLEKLENEPLIYGGDIGNPAIMRIFCLEVHGIDLPLEAFSAMASVSRRKNLILWGREDLDHREIYAIDRGKEEKYITKPFPLFDSEEFLK